MTARFNLPALLLGSAVAAMSPAVMAATFESTVTTQTALTGVPDKQDAASSQTAGGVASSSLEVMGGSGFMANATGSGWAQAGYGAVQAFARSEAVGYTYGNSFETSAYVGASATLKDTFTVTCATCAAGSYGLLTFGVILNGGYVMNGGIDQQFGGVNSGTVNWSSRMSLSADSVPYDPDWSQPPASVSIMGWVNQSGGSMPGQVLGEPGYRTATLRFAFNEAITLDMTAEASSAAWLTLAGAATGVSGWQSSTTDLTGGVTWAGITGVTTLDGVAVQGYSARNALGIDYTQSFEAVAAVPEPGTWALMAAGALMLAGLRRRGPQKTRSATLAV